MASRRIVDLAPELQPLALSLIEKAKMQGIDVIITCTYRSNAEQAEIYKYGRDPEHPGPRRTNALPGQSLHNYTLNGKPCARAFDVAIIEHGKCNWDANSHVWQVVGELGESLGLEWGHRWRSFPESPHFQKK